MPTLTTWEVVITDPSVEAVPQGAQMTITGVAGSTWVAHREQVEAEELEVSESGALLFFVDGMPVRGFSSLRWEELKRVSSRSKEQEHAQQ